MTSEPSILPTPFTYIYILLNIKIHYILYFVRKLIWRECLSVVDHGIEFLTRISPDYKDLSLQRHQSNSYFSLNKQRKIVCNCAPQNFTTISTSITQSVLFVYSSNKSQREREDNRLRVNSKQRGDKNVKHQQMYSWIRSTHQNCIYSLFVFGEHTTGFLQYIFTDDSI